MGPRVIKGRELRDVRGGKRHRLGQSSPNEHWHSLGPASIENAFELQSLLGSRLPHTDMPDIGCATIEDTVKLRPSQDLLR